MSFVHRSYLNENPGSGLSSNERLEFLGDAVLGLITARWLFRRYSDLPEGTLTEMRAALVRKETLGTVGRRLGLGEHLLLGRGEDRAGGRERELNVARTFEAVVGAIAEDRGLSAAEAFIRRALAPELAALGDSDTTDPKSRLQHVAQSRWHRAPLYRVVSASGPEHQKTFVVEVAVSDETLASGEGGSKQEAERAAARAALAGLDEQALRVDTPSAGRR